MLSPTPGLFCMLFSLLIWACSDWVISGIGMPYCMFSPSCWMFWMLCMMFPLLTWASCKDWVISGGGMAYCMVCSLCSLVRSGGSWGRVRERKSLSGSRLDLSVSGGVSMVSIVAWLSLLWGESSTEDKVWSSYRTVPYRLVFHRSPLIAESCMCGRRVGGRRRWSRWSWGSARRAAWRPSAVSVAWRWCWGTAGCHQTRTCAQIWNEAEY